MDSFYDLEGNEISRKSLVELMINYFRELVETEDTKITDFNEGSEIRNLMESIAVDLYHLEYVTYNQMKMAFLKYATGQWLDLPVTITATRALWSQLPITRRNITDIRPTARTDVR